MDKTPLQAFREKLNRREGLVRISDLSEFLTSTRARCADDLLKHEITERAADRLRGKATFCLDLHNALTDNPDE